MTRVDLQRPRLRASHPRRGRPQASKETGQGDWNAFAAELVIRQSTGPAPTARS